MDSLTVGHFNIGTHQPGAPTFTCALTLHDGHAVGVGNITQAIHPALKVSTYLSGTVASILWGADDTQIIALSGHAFRLPMPPNPVNVECMIQLDSLNSGRDRASLSYVDEQGKWVKLENLPVQVKWHRAPD